MRSSTEWQALDTGRQIVGELRALGEAQGVKTRALGELGNPNAVIVELARRENMS